MGAFIRPVARVDSVSEGFKSLELGFEWTEVLLLFNRDTLLFHFQCSLFGYFFPGVDKNLRILLSLRTADFFFFYDVAAGC